MKKILRITEITLVTLSFAGLFLYRKEVALAVWEAMSYSARALLPSLLPFMFLSSVLSRRPLYGLICRLLSPVTRYLFRLPSVCGGVIFSGLCFGYPVGAKMTSEFLERGLISKEEAGRMLCFCVSPGVAFCLLYLRGIFGSVSLILFAAVSLSCIITGAILSIGSEIPTKSYTKFKESDLWESIRAAADSSAAACLSMVMYIVLFRSLIALLESSGILSFLSRWSHLPFFSREERELLLAFILEVSSGIERALSLRPSLGMIAFGLGFGGLCIIFQLLSFFPKRPLGFFAILVSRLFQGLLSAVLAEFLCRFLPFSGESIAVFSTNTVNIPGGTESEALGFVFLVLLFGCYILSDRKNRLEKSNEK